MLLIYDIIADEGGAKVTRNIFKTCKRYLTNVQKSVFEGNLTKSELLALKYELNNYVRRDRDSVIMYISRSENWIDKQFLGVKDNKTSNIF